MQRTSSNERGVSPIAPNAAIALLIALGRCKLARVSQLFSEPPARTPFLNPAKEPRTCTRRNELVVRGMQSILVKPMKDSVVRGCLLQLLYQRRSEGFIPFGHAEQAVPPPAGINRRDWLHAVAQLSEYRLIDWTPLEDKSGTGVLSGFAKINDLGVKVLEAGVAPPIRISIDESRRTTVPRQQQAPIGASTPQQEAIMEALENVITAINQADVSEQEKMEARSLLRKLLRSKAAASVLGARAQSLAAKCFTQ
jgi:hypothetical protein